MIVIGSLPVDERFVANTSFTRAKLETFIQTNFERVRGQLPGCNGRCRSFLCTEGKHMGCFLPNEPMLL